MKINDFCSAWETHNDAEIEEGLSIRHEGGLNHFWLSNGIDKYPSLSVLVKNDLASLNYFPRPRDPGYRSCGKKLGLRAGEFTLFAINKTEQQQVINDSIVSISDAVAVAKQFSKSATLPTAIEWLGL